MICWFIFLLSKPCVALFVNFFKAPSPSQRKASGSSEKKSYENALRENVGEIDPTCTENPVNVVIPDDSGSQDVNNAYSEVEEAPHEGLPDLLNSKQISEEGDENNEPTIQNDSLEEEPTVIDDSVEQLEAEASEESSTAE